MAKRKTTAVEQFNNNDFFATQLAQREKENFDKIVIGLPLNAISLRYIFSNDVFPYSRVTELVGVSESCKTALLFEIYRWHIFNTTDLVAYDPSEMHGGYVHNLVEPRDSPDLRESILQLGPYSPYPVIQSDSVEDWQKSCTDWVKKAEERFELGAMPYPVALGVDSLTAVTTQDEMDKTWSQGFADPGYSQIAKSINLWFKVFCNKMARWPVSFVGVNHLKEHRAANGAIDRKIPGGTAIKFASTFLLRLSRKDDIETLNESGLYIEIATEKNSLSPANHENLKVRMTWRFDENGEQQTIWDWHDASIELLTSFDATRKRRISEIINIESVDKSRRTADCPTLGLKKTSWHELGKAIMEEPEIVKGLDRFFGVRNRRKFELGVPYCEQVDKAKLDASYLGGLDVESAD